MHVKKSLSRRSIFLLVAVMVAVTVLAATAYTLLRLRAEAIDRHFDTASMYARTFEEHLTHSFNVIDLTLANVANEARTTTALAAALRHAPYLRSLALLDAKDVIAASSNPSNVGTRIVRGDFLPQTPDPRAIIRAGPPWTGRDFHEGRATTPEFPAVPEAQTLIPVLRDIALDNDARATTVASVNTDYFLNYYGRSLAVEAGTVELLRYDGILLLSTDVRRKPGIHETGNSLPGRIAADELGRFEQQLGDGRTVLTAYRASRTYPFAGELHDRTSPNLSAIGVHLDIMTATLLEGELGTVPERLEDVRALIEDTTASIREICSDLRPPVLDYAGLVAALESYIRQFQRRSGIAVRFDCSHGTARLTPALESVFFRVVQEALTNCAKHSRAKSITVTLKMDEDPAVLKISDDGIGFDPGALGKTTHTHGLGLLTMRDMTEFSGGQFILDSIPGRGTRISVEITTTEGPA